MTRTAPHSATPRRSVPHSVRRPAGAACTALAATLLAAGCASPAGSPGCETELLLTHHDSGEQVHLTHAAAIGVQDGAAYTAWAADFAFDEEVTTWFDPEIPPEGNLAWISWTVFNAEGEVPILEAGDQIPADAPHGEHVLVVVHQTADEDFGQSQGAEGGATLTDLGEQLCAEIDYSDDQKSLVGTLGATVVW